MQMDTVVKQRKSSGLALALLGTRVRPFILVPARFAFHWIALMT